MSGRTQAQLEEEQRREATCEAFGHQDVVEIPHAEICEHPWRRDHDGVDVADVPPDRLCRHCQDWVTT